MFRKSISPLFILLAILMGCVVDEDATNHGLGKTISINEIMADNETTLPDPDFGEYGDWIELYNAGDVDILLEGFFMSDDPEEPMKWQLPSEAQIPANGFLLIWADDHDTGLHTNFKLSKSGESVALFDPSLASVDEVTFGEQEADISYGRFPDGADTFETFHTPTPGSSNESDTPPPPAVVINEIMADNETTLVDPDFGEYGDWIELYNASGVDVSLEGFFLSDDPEEPGMWQLPSEAQIPDGGFLLIWADKHDTGLHTNFKLGKSGESVVLFDPSLASVDEVTFGEQEADISYGRFPDNADAFETFHTPTPGSSNESDTPLPPDVVINEFMADNETTLVDPDFGEYGDWIELYNAGDVDVSLEGFFLSDDPAEPGMWQLPGEAQITAGGFLLIWADKNDTGLHTNFKLGKSGESVALFDPSLASVDEVTFGEQETDVSYGRFPDGEGTWGHMAAATPDGPNTEFTP